MDVSVGAANDLFKINLRTDSANTKRASLSLTEHTTGLRIVTDAGVAGIAVGAPSTGAITYGLTLDFLNDTYTTWIGTPTSGNSTWANRFGAGYTGAWDIGTEVIDGLQWSVTDYSNANSVILDQIQISTTAIPEPQTYGLLAGILVIGAVVLRRRSV
jgi:hypothetical protein